MSNILECIKARLTIREYISPLANLCGLAEECGELAAAAMKIARAKGFIADPTPVKEEEARRNLKEEAIDVCIRLTVLGVMPTPDEISTSPKWLRWVKRIQAGEREARHESSF